jgi:hypothetical protein
MPNQVGGTTTALEALGHLLVTNGTEDLAFVLDTLVARDLSAKLLRAAEMAQGLCVSNDV